MAGPRTTSGSVPEYISSPVLGEIAAAEWAEHADHVEAQAAEAGKSRITEARVRMLRRFAVQTTEAHGDVA